MISYKFILIIYKYHLQFILKTTIINLKIWFLKLNFFTFIFKFLNLYKHKFILNFLRIKFILKNKFYLKCKILIL